MSLGSQSSGWGTAWPVVGVVREVGSISPSSCSLPLWIPEIFHLINLPEGSGDLACCSSGHSFQKTDGLGVTGEGVWQNKVFPVHRMQLLVRMQTPRR